MNKLGADSTVFWRYVEHAVDSSAEHLHQTMFDYG